MATHDNLKRKIIHIDMDCFYAAIEMREHSRLADKPVAVGGKPTQRGVICTSNYQARQYGIHSAMSSSEALRRCPKLVLLPVDMPKYKRVSEQIRTIFHQFTHQVEPLSLDEAFLDVSQCTIHQGSATRIAQTIRQEINSKLSLTASAGVAPNKLLAKIASDWHKPDGLMVITPPAVSTFMQALAVKKLFGVGKVTQRKLHELNITTCANLQQLSLIELQKQFGKFGQRLYDFCRGIDDRLVEPNRIRKSVSVERTLSTDLVNIDQASVLINKLFSELQHRLATHKEKSIKCIIAKVKFSDFHQTTVERTATQLDIQVVHSLVVAGYLRYKKPIRLIGIGVKFYHISSNFNLGKQRQFQWNEHL